MATLLRQAIFNIKSGVYRFLKVRVIDKYFIYGLEFVFYNIQICFVTCYLLQTKDSTYYNAINQRKSWKNHKYPFPVRVGLLDQSYDGLIVRSDTKVTKEVIEAASKLKVIGRAGAGVDNIDVNAATKNKILVLNTPGGNAISACELTCTLITALSRNVVPGAASLKAGRWDRKLFSGHEIYGKVLGIVGLGRIGREVAVRMQAWGMKTVGFDPIVSADDAAKFNVEFLPLEEIWPIADYITLHVPLLPETRNLIDAKVLSKCKKGVKIVNVARGGIIDENALFEALESGQCNGAGLDVYEQEPPTNEITWKLIKHPKVVATPHLGASTAEAQVRVAVEVSEQFVALTKRNPSFTATPGIINHAVLTMK